MNSAARPDLYNGTLETGVRSVIVLNSFRPLELDREQLGLLDYFIVHTSQADGPADLNPTYPASFSEYHVRRRRIDEGIKLLVRVRLIDVLADPARGVCFRAGDDAPGFVDLLHSPYNRDLVQRAAWLRQKHDEDGTFLAGLRDRIERWSVEFQRRETPGTSE